jgi:hypothetical protein
MIKVEFNSEVEGVTEVTCHHITVLLNKIHLHFTKTIRWEIDVKDICLVNGERISFSRLKL